MPLTVPAARVSVDEQTVPPLEAEQGPDQEPVVDTAVEVLVEHAPDVRALEVPPLGCPRVEQDFTDVIHRRTAVPRAIGWAETLLALVEDVLRENRKQGFSPPDRSWYRGPSM